LLPIILLLFDPANVWFEERNKLRSESYGWEGSWRNGETLRRVKWTNETELVGGTESERSKWGTGEGVERPRKYPSRDWLIAW